MLQLAIVRAHVLGIVATLAACGTDARGAPEPLPGPRPPSRPAATASGEERWFVVTKLQYGVTDRVTGKSSPDGWKDYGFDLDRTSTTGEDSPTGSCRRKAGSQRHVLEDGLDGRDDNFARFVMPIAQSLNGDVEARANAALASGAGPTLLIHLSNVGPDDNGSVPGEILSTASVAHAPSFDESDHFPVDERSIDAAGKAIAQFPRGYMAGGVWVSGDGDDRFVLRVPFAYEGYPLELSLQGFVSFDVRKLSSGTVAGAVSASALEKAAMPSLRSLGSAPAARRTSRSWRR